MTELTLPLASRPPAIGAFIRPVGRYRYLYCYQLERVIGPDHTDGRDQWHLRRFGLANGMPVRDGRQNMHYISNLKPAAPGLWRDEWEFETDRWSCCPLYYRLMDVKGAQLGLFGGERLDLPLEAA